MKPLNRQFDIYKIDHTKSWCQTRHGHEAGQPVIQKIDWLKPIGVSDGQNYLVVLDKFNKKKYIAPEFLLGGGKPFYFTTNKTYGFIFIEKKQLIKTSVQKYVSLSDKYYPFIDVPFLKYVSASESRYSCHEINRFNQHLLFFVMDTLFSAN